VIQDAPFIQFLGIEHIIKFFGNAIGQIVVILYVFNMLRNYQKNTGVIYPCDIKFITMKFLLIAYTIILAGCSGKVDDLYELAPANKIISFTLTSQTTCFSNCVSYFKGKQGVEYFVLQNKELNRIELYDFIAGKLLKVIPFSKEGPNGVSEICGFAFKGLDSIFLFNDRTDQCYFYLTDTSGRIKRRFDTDNRSKKYFFVPRRTSSVLNTSIYFENDSIAIVPSFIPYGFDKPEEIANCKLLAKVNIRSGQSEILPVPYPVLYNRRNLPVDSDFSFIKNAGKYIFAFCASDYIYYLDGGQQLKKVEASSRYLGGKDFISNTTDDSWNFKKILSSPYYSSLYFDRRNRLYYRFVRHGDNPTPEGSFKSQLIYPKEFSIIIMDESFKVVGETLMPKNRYMLGMSFMTDEGLYISTSNINAPDFDENHLRFQLFTVKRKH